MIKKVIIFVACCLLSCTHPAPDPINVALLLDCSSSVSEGRGSIEGDILQIGMWWAEQGMRRDGGSFEVMIIGRGIDDVTLFFSKRCPDEFRAPVYESKRQWLKDFQAELRGLPSRLPTDQGSAVLEAIFRASHRLSESNGEKILIIYSDFRQVNRDFNFEVSIPDMTMLKRWLRQQNLTPELNGIRLLVIGFKPYPPNATTPKITPEEYGKLYNLWSSLFEEWGVKVKMSETFNIKYLKGDDTK